MQRANDQLRMMVEEDPQLEGMGTTLTALLWTGQRLGLVHVGDSRAYLLRDGVLTQITQDHTWVQRLVDEGRITEEEAATHPQRSLLMRALGSGDHVEPDLSIREVRAGDRYLICSDGLSGVVPPDLEDTLASYQGPTRPCSSSSSWRCAVAAPTTSPASSPTSWTSTPATTRSPGSCPTYPVVVGAVAENQHNQHHLHDGGAMQTPAGRGLRARPARPAHDGGGGEFGPPGSGDTTGYVQTGGGFGGYSDEDFVKPAPAAGGSREPLYITLALAVIGGGLYGGYRWTQTQYYVGASDKHVALYRGINQDLRLDLKLSKVDDGPPRDRTEVPARLPAEAGRGHHHGGRPQGRPVEDLRAGHPGLRVQEAGSDDARPATRTTARPARARSAAPREPPVPPPRPKATPSPNPSPTTPSGIGVPVHNRTHSHTRPQPLRGRAEAGLAVR